MFGESGQKSFEGDYDDAPPVFTLTPIVKEQTKVEETDWNTHKPVDKSVAYPVYSTGNKYDNQYVQINNKSNDYQDPHLYTQLSATQWVNRPNLVYQPPPDVKFKIEKNYQTDDQTKFRYNHNIDPLGENINPFDFEPPKESGQHTKRPLSPQFNAPSFLPARDEQKPLTYHTPSSNKRAKREHTPESYSPPQQQHHIEPVEDRVPLYQPPQSRNPHSEQLPTQPSHNHHLEQLPVQSPVSRNWHVTESPPALESPFNPSLHAQLPPQKAPALPAPAFNPALIPPNPWYKPSNNTSVQSVAPVRSPYFNNPAHQIPSSYSVNHSVPAFQNVQGPVHPNVSAQRPNAPIQHLNANVQHPNIPVPVRDIQTYHVPDIAPPVSPWHDELDRAFDQSTGAQNHSVNIQPPSRDTADSRWSFQPPPRRDPEYYPPADLTHHHEEPAPNTHNLIISAPPRTNIYDSSAIRPPEASYDSNPLTFAKLTPSTPSNRNTGSWSSKPPPSTPVSGTTTEITSSDIVPTPAKSKLKLKAKPERGQLTMDKFFQPTPPKPSSSNSNGQKPATSSLDDSDLEIENVTIKPKVTPLKPSKTTNKKSKAKPKKPILDGSDDEAKEVVSPPTKASSSKAKKKPQPSVDPADFTAETSSDYNKHNSQTSFNRHMLDKLATSGHLNLTKQENLQPFWNLCSECQLVVVSAIWIDGSTCFRPPSSKQKALFRTYVRQHRAKATPKECEEREKRSHGAMLAIALVFRFFVSVQPEGPKARSAGDFFLPLCEEGRNACADDSSVHSSQDQFFEQQVRTCVSMMLQNNTIYKLVFNAKDVLATWLSYSQEFSLGMVTSLIDPQIAAWILDPDDTLSTGLELLALMRHYLRKESVYPWATQEHSIGAFLVIGALVEDLSDVVDLWYKLTTELTAKNLSHAFWSQEMALVPILSEIQTHGIAFDGVSFAESLHYLENKMIQLNKRCMELSGSDFLISSPQQVSEVLFGKMKFQPVSTGERGRSAMKTTSHLSTGEPVIQQLLARETDPDRKALLQSISEYRKLLKIKNSYIEPLQSAAEPAPAFAVTQSLNHQAARAIYCQWNQCAAGTGRLSTSMPNLQALPRGTKEITTDDEQGTDDIDTQVLNEINIRSCFHPSRPNKVFLSADFNQMEMRIMAQFSEDPALIDFFRAGGINDVYRFMGSLCFDVEESKVTSQQRAIAKTLSLGIAYGMGPDNMAAKLTHHIGQPYTRIQAKQLIDKWYSRMSGVQKFMAKCRTDARVHGFVRTYAQRWRRLPKIKSHNRQEQAQAERQAVNSVIQGTASDLCKRAMILIHDDLNSIEGNQSGAVASLSLQIHDEIVVEVDQAWLPEVAARVKNLMENVFPDASISFPVNLKAGPALGKLEPYSCPIPAATEISTSCPDLAFTPQQLEPTSASESYFQTPVSSESREFYDQYQSADSRPVQTSSHWDQSHYQQSYQQQSIDYPHYSSSSTIYEDFPLMSKSSLQQPYVPPDQVRATRTNSFVARMNAYNNY